ncbi:MAG: MoaD/ThiS family protein [Thermoplasmata archaeon]|nr:MoaD/ThiS family protein [Thermoplasmata archaeon]
MTATGATPRRSAPPTGRVRVLLFSTARTAVGSRSLSWPVGPDGTTVRELAAGLARAHPRVAPILGHCRYFHDDVLVKGLDERLPPGAELAIHPPYGGG